MSLNLKKMSTNSDLSKLWKTEDWLACWLGFIIIAIGIVAVLTKAFEIGRAHV